MTKIDYGWIAVTWVAVVIVLLFNVCSAEAGQTTLLKGQPIYEDPLAYKRSPESSFSIKESRYLGQKIKYLEAVIGKNVPIASKRIGGVDLQIGAIVTTWMTLGYDNGSFPLLTQDFLMAVPLSARRGNLSCSLRFNHISAHLGDGMDAVQEEALTEEEKQTYDLYERIANSAGVGLNLTQPFAYSRDFATAHIAYEYQMGQLKGKTYIQGGYAWKMIPKKLGRHFVGGGTEARFPAMISPYYALDVTYNGDVDVVDVSVQAGVFLSPEDRDGVTVRLAFNGHNGSDRRGQLVGRKLKQIGFGLFIR